MDGLLRDLFKNNKFIFIVFRSFLISILVIITANEYHNIITKNKIGIFLFTLTLFFVIYVFYLQREFKNVRKR